MSRFWNTKTRQIEPYVAGEQPGNPSEWIKLNTNENPYPPSPAVTEAIMNELYAGTDMDSEKVGNRVLKVSNTVLREVGDVLRFYPNPDADDFLESICERFSLRREQVFAGNGSDEILAFSFIAFWDRDRPVMAPAVSYSFYPVYADIFDIPLKRVPMTNGLEVDVDGIISGDGGVVIANPNAPTSVALTLHDIRRILDSRRNEVVLVDEAYIDYGGESAITLLPEYENLLVVRTLSKSYSLAGMRVGFAAGSPELIEGLRRVRDSFNSYPLDRLAIAAGAAAIRDIDYFEESREMVLSTRARTAAELCSLGFRMPDSSTNFLFVTHPDHAAKDIFMHLRERKMLVRYFNKPDIDNYLRITIGTDKEMDLLVSALKEILAEE
jgi:histidinol-phosphate aminotransferase